MEEEGHCFAMILALVESSVVCIGDAKPERVELSAAGLPQAHSNIIVPTLVPTYSRLRMLASTYVMTTISQIRLVLPKAHQ